MKNNINDKNIAIIGSDIFGAIGNAAQFANYGARVTFYLGDSEIQDCDVAALTTNSKHVSPRLAYNKTRDAVRKCNSRHIYLQEDSSLRGNLSSSIEAIIAELNPRKILICLSSPAKSRHVQGGVVHIGGLPVDQSEVANDPLSPVKEAHIPKLIYKNIKIKSKVLGLDIIDKGPLAILKHIVNNSEKIIVLDALEPQHFRNIAGAIRLVGDECVTYMAAGLSKELPFVHGYSREKLKTIEPLNNKKPVLLVIGSYEPIIGTQLHRASEATGLSVIPLDTAGLLSRKRRDGRIREYCEKVIEALRTGSNVAITSNSSKFIPQLRHKMAYLLAEIAAEALCSCDVGALLTSGSDTTYAVCDTLRVQEIDILGSNRTGVNTTISRLHMNGGNLPYLGSRAGAVGGPDDIQETLEILRPVQATQ